MKKNILLTFLLVLNFCIACQSDLPEIDKVSELKKDETETAITEKKPIPLIWDDDGSPDGIIALLYFLKHSDVEVLAATVSYGEAHPPAFIGDVVAMLDYVGFPDIPVAAGQDSPLEGNNAFPEFLRAPTENFWGISFPKTESYPSSMTAPELIVQTILESPEPVIVFVSGSFTNLAEAIRLDPEIVDKIKTVECMGGAIYDPGNVGGVWDFGINNKVAEWNIFVDPLAAYEVFESGVKVNLTPLDATNLVYTSRTEFKELMDIGTPISDVVADLLLWKLDFQNTDELPIFDLLAAVNTTDPEVCDWEELPIHVNKTPGKEHGHTFIDSEKQTLTRVCLKPDQERVNELVVRTFSE